MEKKRQKVALVTGASRGIGKSIAKRLAEKGIKVVVNYNRSAKEAEKVVDEIKANNGDAVLVSGDVGSPDDVQRMFREIKEKAGVVDILVNNAGVTKDTALFRMNFEDWHKILNTNLTGTFNCIKAAFFDMMKKKDGRIVNISSLSSYYGAPGQANYAASKAGIVGLTRCLASEFGPMNITVNAVIPGLIPTDMTGKMPEDKIQALSAKVPLKRLGTPDDIASMVEFITSDSAAYITGQVFIVDGGLSCSLGA